MVARDIAPVTNAIYNGATEIVCIICQKEQMTSKAVDVKRSWS